MDDSRLPESSAAPAVRLALEAMRTRFEIVIPVGADEAASDLRAAGEEALAEIATVESWLSAYRSDAPLHAINLRGAAAPVRVEARVLAFLERARALSAATDGAFDPTVGPLLDVWGLAGDAAGRVPTDTEIAAARSLVGMDRNVLLDEEAQTVSFAVPGVRLDPGGIGKGFALDRAVDLLHDSGVRMALLHGGTSTVVGVGTPLGSPDGWPVAVQHPGMPDARIITAYLRDAALSVSAIHGKSFWAQGRRFGHVLDPRTGRPVENPLLAAVTAPSATETDALSTALLVLGVGGMERLRARFPGASFLVAEEDRFAPDGLRVVTAGRAWNTPDGSSGSSEPEEQSAQPRE